MKVAPLVCVWVAPLRLTSANAPQKKREKDLITIVLITTWFLESGAPKSFDYPVVLNLVSLSMNCLKRNCQALRERERRGGGGGGEEGQTDIVEMGGVSERTVTSTHFNCKLRKYISKTIRLETFTYCHDETEIASYMS